jgi:hypothetical protein
VSDKLKKGKEKKRKETAEKLDCRHSQQDFFLIYVTRRFPISTSTKAYFPVCSCSAYWANRMMGVASVMGRTQARSLR